MKGHEIAKKLKVSTSALKHYENWGLIPKVERGENGYRIYANIHESYFKTIRALKAGFGMDLVKKMMPLILKGDYVTALWLINSAQVDLQKEKFAAEKIVQMLDNEEIIRLSHSTQTHYFIGEVAKKAKVSTSSLRHWEKEKLISPARDNESGFRIYNTSDLRKILIIRTVQRAVFSLDIVREVFSEIEGNNFHQAKKIAQQSIQYIDNSLMLQVKGIATLNDLLETIQELNME